MTVTSKGTSVSALGRKVAASSSGASAVGLTKGSDVPTTADGSPAVKVPELVTGAA